MIDAEWMIRRPGGTELVAQGSAAPVVDPADPSRRLGAVLTIREVTRLREIERARLYLSLNVLLNSLRQEKSMCTGALRCVQEHSTQENSVGP